MARRTIRFSAFLADQLSNRYAMFPREHDGKSNLVMDSFIPKLIVDGLRGAVKDAIPSTSYCISAWFSNTYSIRQLPFEIMVETLGFTKKEINRLILDVKKQKLNMILAGFGGTGVNTWHWLSEMMTYTGQTGLFQIVDVYDHDKTSFDNLLRFPFDPNSINQMSSASLQMKVDMCTDKASICRRVYKHPVKLDFNSDSVLYSGSCEISNKEDEGKKHVKPKENTFIYGAPDLESRDKYRDMKFLSATHGDDECSLIVKPLIDTNIQVESYGLIRLNSFFMNQLRMSIALLEFLAANDEKKWDTPAEEVFKFNFKDYVNEGNAVLKSKVINWQVNHNGVVETTQGDQIV